MRPHHNLRHEVLGLDRGQHSPSALLRPFALLVLMAGALLVSPWVSAAANPALRECNRTCKAAKSACIAQAQASRPAPRYSNETGVKSVRYPPSA